MENFLCFGQKISKNKITSILNLINLTAKINFSPQPPKMTKNLQTFLEIANKKKHQRIRLTFLIFSYPHGKSINKDFNMQDTSSSAKNSVTKNRFVRVALGDLIANLQQSQYIASTDGRGQYESIANSVLFFTF